MTTQEFRKQIGKYFGAKMREFGFKGSGFNYILYSESYVYTIGLQASRYGGSFCVELGIQPKEITNNGFQDLDFTKLKYYNCEFRTRLSKERKGANWWDYNDSELKNLETIDDVIHSISKYALPVINSFKNDTQLLERVQISDIKNRFIPIPAIKDGLTPMTTDIRLAWALAVVIEKTNPKKSLEFAKYALKHDKSPSTFFGTKDLKRIIETYEDDSEKDVTAHEMDNDKPSFWTRITNKLRNR